MLLLVSNFFVYCTSMLVVGVISKKNCAHFEESMKHCMDKLKKLNKYRGGHK